MNTAYAWRCDPQAAMQWPFSMMVLYEHQIVRIARDIKAQANR